MRIERVISSRLSLGTWRLVLDDGRVVPVVVTAETREYGDVYVAKYMLGERQLVESSNRNAGEAVGRVLAWMMGSADVREILAPCQESADERVTAETRRCAAFCENVAAKLTEQAARLPSENGYDHVTCKASATALRLAAMGMCSMRDLDGLSLSTNAADYAAACDKIHRESANLAAADGPVARPKDTVAMAHAAIEKLWLMLPDSQASRAAAVVVRALADLADEVQATA